jgi:putative ABC transport system permease protein
MLLAVRSGVIDSMRAELERDPSSRELRTVGQPIIRWRLVQELRSRSDVGFVRPTTRLLAATGVLRQPGDPLGGQAIDLAPDGKDDPLAATAGVHNPAADEIVISDTASRELHVRTHDRVDLIVERTSTAGVRQSEIRPLRVAGILPAWLGARDLALIDSDLLTAIEVFRENDGVADLASASGIARLTRGSRSYAGLRLYARDIDAVEDVRSYLQARGIETEGRLDEIRLIQRLNTALTTLFVILASIVSVGLCCALAAAQWAWVDRKRRDLSYLRLVGLGANALALIPMAQSTLTALCGVSLAALLSWAGAALVNLLFSGQLSGVTQISRIEPAHLAMAAGLAAIAGLLASFVAAASARRIAPATILREA